MVTRASVRPAVVAKAAKKSAMGLAAAAPAVLSAPAAFAAQELEQLALQDVNILGVIATALFIILYVKSASEGNVSGGFSQEYYDKSKARGDKKTNEAAILKGAGLGMRPEK